MSDVSMVWQEVIVNLLNLCNMDVREKPHRLPASAYRGRRTVSYTACIEGRRRPFANFETVRQFVSILGEAVGKYDCLVPVYCFMPDHVHIITAGFSTRSDGKAAIAEFKHQTGIWFAAQGAGFHWQKDFHDHVVRHTKDRAAHIRYVLNNPVRAGLVESCLDHPGTGSIGVDIVEYLRDLDEERKFGSSF